MLMMMMSIFRKKKLDKLAIVSSFLIYHKSRVHNTKIIR